MTDENLHIMKIHKKHNGTSLIAILLTSLTLMAILLPIGNARAADLQTYTSADLQTIFEDIIHSNHPYAIDDMRIANFSSRPHEIELPSGDVDYSIISQNKARQLGREIIYLALSVDGQEITQVKLSGDVQLFGEVVCAVRSIKRHSIISRDDIEIVRRNTSMLGPDFISSATAVIGKELKTTLRPGAVLFNRLVKSPELVKRGDMVTIMALNSGLKVSVPGVAQTSGAHGELVRVKNMMSRKEIYAKVVAPDQVLVEF